MVGLHGGQCFGTEAEAALRDADVLIGRAPASSSGFPAICRRAYRAVGALEEALDLGGTPVRRGQRVCVLAAGDPGFFGLVRLASARLGPGRFAVHPAPSSVSLAFARVGVNWEDALVVRPTAGLCPRR